MDTFQLKNTKTGKKNIKHGNKTIDNYRMVIYNIVTGNKNRKKKEGDDLKSNEIKAERIRRKFTQQYMADVLGISVHSYRKKENGFIPFTEKEKFEIATILNLSFEQFDDFLFDNKIKEVFFVPKLPNGNESDNIGKINT